MRTDREFQIGMEVLEVIKIMLITLMVLSILKNVLSPALTRIPMVLVGKILLYLQMSLERVLETMVNSLKVSSRSAIFRF